MLLSIIIPAYNADRYIENAIESAIDYECLDQYEILVIDDGSSDTTRALCLDKSRQYFNIKYYYKQNGGVSSARNYGMTKAKGSYITFLDSDDQYETGAIPEIIRSLRECPDMLCFGFQRIDENGNYREKRVPPEKKESNINGLHYLEKELKMGREIQRNVVTCCFRKEIIESNNVRFNEEYTWAEDFDFIMCAFAGSKNILALEKSLYKYVYNPASATRTVNSKNVLSEMRVATKWLHILDEYEGYDSLKEYFSEFFCNSMSVIANITDNKGEVEAYAECHFRNTRYAQRRKYIFAIKIWKIIGIHRGAQWINIINQIRKRVQLING